MLHAKAKLKKSKQKENTRFTNFGDIFYNLWGPTSTLFIFDHEQYAGPTNNLE